MVCAVVGCSGESKDHANYVALGPTSSECRTVMGWRRRFGAGTATTVREFSQRIMHEFGGRLIRINPTDSSVPTLFDVGFAAGAALTLTAIDNAHSSLM